MPRKPVRRQAAPKTPKLSDVVIDWIEGRDENFSGLRVPEGKDVGEPVRLRPFHRKIIRGVYDSPTRTAIISVGRKNAKTTLAAMLLLVHLVGPLARPNSSMYSSAMSREQAAILYKLAAKMVRLSRELNAYVTCRDTKKELHCPGLGTFYGALSAEASTQFGLSPVLIVHDELGQVKGPTHALYEALETATGAQKNPLSIIISTQAPTDNDLLSTLIDDAMDQPDPRVKLFLWTAPMDANPFAKATIKKANPAFGDFQDADEVMRMAAEAKRMPSREAAYRNLVLNQRIEVSHPFCPRSVWEENGKPPAALGGAPVYMGLDLSETNDLTALIAGAPGPNGSLDVHATFWLPREGLAERARKDRVPYDVWHKEGHLAVTPGHSIDYDYVAQHVVQLFQTHDVRRVAFDRWNMRHFRPCLVRAGLPEALIDERFVDFGQGYQSMSPALRTLETLLLNRRIRHGKHPVLSMCNANAVVKGDEAGNRKLDKKRSRGRIDGMVGLAMMSAVAAEDMNNTPVFPVAVERILEDVHA